MAFKDIEPHLRGWLHLLSTGVDETTARVEKIHRKIADIPFDAAEKIPVVGAAAGTLHQVEKKVTAGVYDTIRHVAKVGIAMAQNALPTQPESNATDAAASTGATAKAPYIRKGKPE